MFHNNIVKISEKNKKQKKTKKKQKTNEQAERVESLPPSTYPTGSCIHFTMEKK